jgi:hypothetical protein
MRSKLTPERCARITESLRSGQFNEVAAGLGGVSERTLYRWLERGERAAVAFDAALEAGVSEVDASQSEDATERAFRHFWHAVARARAEAEARNCAVIQAAAVPHKQETVTVETRPVFDRNGRMQLDGNGKPVVATITTVRRETVGDWRASAWYLERARGERWRQRKEVDVSPQEYARAIRDALDAIEATDGE